MAEATVRSSNADVVNLVQAVFALIGRNILAIVVFFYIVWSTCCTIRVTYPILMATLGGEL